MEEQTPNPKGGRYSVHPYHLARLVEVTDVSRASRLTGVSTAGIQTALKVSKTSPSAEMAAKLQLEKLESKGEAKNTRSRILIIKVTPEQQTMLKPLFEATGVRIAFAEDV